MSYKRERPLLSLGYNQGEVQHNPFKIARLEDGNLPVWYKTMTDLSTKTQTKSVKCNMLSEITHWETLFAPAPKDLHFMKIKDYLRTGSAITLHKIDKQHHVTLLNEDGRDVIRSLLVYIKQSLEKEVTHDSLPLNMIYLNRVGEIRVKKPIRKIAEGGDKRIYIEKELARCRNIISDLCNSRQGIPLDVHHLLRMLNFNCWSHSSFVVNHPCFWPPKNFEGVVILLRQRIWSYHLHGVYVIGALQRVPDLMYWGQTLRSANFQVGKCCMISQLGFIQGSKYDENHLCGFLQYLRDLFVHGHDNYRDCPGGKSCKVLTSSMIFYIMHHVFPNCMVDFFFELYSTPGIPWEIKELLLM